MLRATRPFARSNRCPRLSIPKVWKSVGSMHDSTLRPPPGASMTATANSGSELNSRLIVGKYLRMVPEASSPATHWESSSWSSILRSPGGGSLSASHRLPASLRSSSLWRSVSRGRSPAAWLRSSTLAAPTGPLLRRSSWLRGRGRSSPRPVPGRRGERELR